MAIGSKIAAPEMTPLLAQGDQASGPVEEFPAIARAARSGAVIAILEAPIEPIDPVDRLITIPRLVVVAVASALL